ncbi:MAG: AraC family transcriptional regulator [Pseudodesulfovibrio sp.]
MKNTTKNLYHERMLTVLLHIQSHLDEDLSLESLAAMTYFSPIHFHRIFKGMIGETVVEHIRRIRLERAASKLAIGSTTVTDSAFEAGYETVESFSRAFKKMFGCPPSKYQQQHWETLYERLPGNVHYLPESARNGLTIKHNEEMTMEVRIENVEPMRVAFIRHIGPYMDCKVAWDKLCAWGGPKGIFSTNPKVIGICYDDPQVTPPEKIRYDACFTVGDHIEAEGEVGIQIIEGGEYAIVTHKGSYDGLEQTYAELMGQWLPQSGREFGSHVSFERYINSPDETPPEKLLTEIYLPLK